MLRSIYFLKSIGLISKIMNANRATKPVLNSVVTLVVNGVMEKNSKIGKILNMRKAYNTRLFFLY